MAESQVSVITRNCGIQCQKILTSTLFQGFEQEKILFHENIKHLEDLRDNLEKTVSEKTENLHSQKIELDEVRKKEECALNKIEEVFTTSREGAHLRILLVACVSVYCLCKC